MIDYFGITPDQRRLKADGKHILDKTLDGNMLVIKCRKCDFKVSAYVPINELVTAAEKAAYLHITEPDLLISGTSDISRATRIAVMNRDHPELVRRVKARRPPRQ